MPIAIRDLDGGLGNLIYGCGVVTGEEYCDSVAAHLSQPKEKLERYLYSLSDFTEVVEARLTPDCIHKIAGISRRLSHEICTPLSVAIVASDDYAFGFSRMWGMLVEGGNWEISIFRDRLVAEGWIRSKTREKHGFNVAFQPDDLVNEATGAI